MKAFISLLSIPLLLAACASNKPEQIGVSPQDYASKLSTKQLRFSMSKVLIPSISSAPDPEYGMIGIGVVLSPFDQHCKAKNGSLTVTNDRFNVMGSALPTKLLCKVDGNLFWQVNINYVDISTYHANMTDNTWIYLTIQSTVNTASEVESQAEKAKLAAYRAQFKNISNSNMAMSFLMSYETYDPDNLIPKVKSLHQSLLDQEDKARKDAFVKKEKEIKDAIVKKEKESREFDKYIKNRGVAVCSKTNGIINQPTEVVVEGQRQYIKVKSIVTIKGSIEEYQSDRVKVRISRIGAMPGGLLNTYDTGDSVFETGKVYWSDKSFWEKC